MQTQTPPVKPGPASKPPVTDKETVMAATKAAPKKKEDGDEGIIILRAYRKKQMQVKVSPLQDSTGKTYTGQGETGYFEDLTDEDKRKMSYVVTPKTTVVIREGKSLDTTKDLRARADWRWMKKHPYIALRHEDGFSSRDAVYYVYNEVQISEENLTRTENIDKAIYKLRFECSEQKRVQIAQSLGHPSASSASPSVVMNWLREEISSPGRENAGALVALTVLKLIEGGQEAKSYQKAMTMFHLLKRYRVIQTYRAGIWRWAGENGLVLGSTQEKVIEFLCDDKNADTVVALEEELIKAKGLTGEDLIQVNEEDVRQPI